MFLLCFVCSKCCVRLPDVCVLCMYFGCRKYRLSMYEVPSIYMDQDKDQFASFLLEAAGRTEIRTGINFWYNFYRSPCKYVKNSTRTDLFP